MKILITANTSWNLIHFRKGLIEGLLEKSFNVITVAPKDRYTDQLDALVPKTYQMPIPGHTTNPITDLVVLFRYLRVLLLERPDIVLAYTVKSNIYCGIATRILKIPIIPNITGLGVFASKTIWLRSVMLFLYKLALHKRAFTFFQNDDDRDLFINLNLVTEERSLKIPGSGINLKEFSPQPLPPKRIKNARLQFYMIARVLKAKGVMEYLAAANILSGEADFHLVGPIDEANPDSVMFEEIENWVRDGVIEYHGQSDTVKEYIWLADCIVLPSYREGTPRALLEAAACGKPIIATDVPGCRAVVDHNINGLLCRPRDPGDLVRQMRLLIDLTEEQRFMLGQAGRAKVESVFDEQVVINQYVQTIGKMHRW